MSSDLEKQLAKMPCPHCDGTGGELLSICCGAPEFCDVEGMCGSCQDWTGFSRCEECDETGLRYPTLSKWCEHCYVEGHPWFNDELGVPVPCFTVEQRVASPT